MPGAGIRPDAGAESARYNASKFAVRGFTESLRHELRGTSIVVTCVHPGGIKTNIMRRARFHQDHTGKHDHGHAIRSFDSLARTTPEQAASQILRGVERRQPRVLVGVDARLIDGMQRLLPVRHGDLLDTVMALMRW